MFCFYCTQINTKLSHKSPESKKSCVNFQMKIFKGPFEYFIDCDQNVFDLYDELLIRSEKINGQSSSNSGRVAYKRASCRLFGNLLFLVPIEKSLFYSIDGQCIVLLLKNSSAKVSSISSDSLEFTLDLVSQSIRIYFLCANVLQRDSWVKYLNRQAYRKLRQKNLVSNGSLITFDEPVEPEIPNLELNLEFGLGLCLKNFMNIFLPFVCLNVSYKFKNSPWIDLGRTEYIQSSVCEFHTVIKVPFYPEVKYKIELFHSPDSVFQSPILCCSYILSSSQIRNYNRYMFHEPYQTSSLTIKLYKPEEMDTNFDDDFTISHKHILPFQTKLSSEWLNLSEKLQTLPNTFLYSANLL